MLWNLLQQMQISDLESSSIEAKGGMRRVSQMQRSLDALCLTSVAMWELLSERLGVKEDELLAKIQEIDLRDGRLDGKITRPPKQCTACQSPNNPSRSQCMYCGKPLPSTPFA